MPAFNGQEVSQKPDINQAFFTIEPGAYTAIVREVKDKDPYYGALPNYSNPKHPGGLWQWIKVVPTIEIINDAHTIIQQQDMTIGIFDDGVPFSPNPKNDPIHTGWYKGRLGAGTLLRALGLMVQGDNGKATLRGDTTKVRDAVVNVRTAVGLYGATVDPVTGVKKYVNFGPDETFALLKEQNGGVPPIWSQYRDLLAAYNTAQGLEGENVLKMKNFVVDIWALSDAQVAAGGYKKDANGTVVLSNVVSAPAQSAPAAGSPAAW